MDYCIAISNSSCVAIFRGHNQKTIGSRKWIPTIVGAWFGYDIAFQHIEFTMKGQLQTLEWLETNLSNFHSSTDSRIFSYSILVHFSTHHWVHCYLDSFPILLDIHHDVVNVKLAIKWKLNCSPKPGREFLARFFPRLHGKAARRIWAADQQAVAKRNHEGTRVAALEFYGKNFIV